MQPRTVIFQDTEELSKSLKQANVRAMQIEGGSFNAVFRLRQFQDWSFQLIEFRSGSSVCVGDASPDRDLLFLPLRNPHGCRLLGKEVDDASVGLYAPRSEHGDVSRPGMAAVVLAPPKDLLRDARERGNRIEMQESGSAHRRMEPARLRRLRYVVQQIERAPPLAEISQTAVRGLVDAITVELIAALSVSLDRAGAGRTPMPRNVVLKRIAEQLAESESEGNLLFASELAASVGVSQPTLQRVFLEWYGLPPAKYLTLRRLYLARERLRSGAYKTVTEAAASCNFIDPSRFSKRYRVIFGELPSQTLGRKFAQ